MMLFCGIFCLIFQSLIEMEGVSEILRQFNDMLKISLQKEIKKTNVATCFKMRVKLAIFWKKTRIYSIIMQITNLCKCPDQMQL